jgi:hypothetical protein
VSLVVQLARLAGLHTTLNKIAQAPPAMPAAPGAPAGNAVPPVMPAANPTFTREDIPKPPLGQKTPKQSGRYYNNAALTHAYKRQQNIDVDPATGRVNNPFDLNAEQMRGLSHYIFPDAGEQYRLNELQRTNQPSPYANRFDYDKAMHGFKGKAWDNQNQLLESARNLYPGMKPGGGGIGFGSIPPDTMKRLRNIGWQSLQSPTAP